MERPPMERALSTDVVMDIVLSHLRVRDLLACRKVSKFWNKAASAVLRKRSTRIENIFEKKNTLKKLEECLKQSSDFPFAGLIFDQPWKLQSADALRFLKNHGARFTYLYLGISSKTRLQDIAPIINCFPRLSNLQVGPPWVCPPDVELYDSAAGQEDDRILNLPSLRTLRISSELNERVLREVLRAASPSLRIECLDATYEMLQALKRVGKLQAVSVMSVDEGKDEEDYDLSVDKLLSTESPALTELIFIGGGCISRKGLMKLLISSQHTLKELRLGGMCPSQFSSECPVLSKLTFLSVCIAADDEQYGYVFQGRHGHKFPALKELKLGATEDGYDPLLSRLSDGLFIVPSLKTIDFGNFFDKVALQDLARCFPNVIEIRLLYRMYDFECSFHSDPSDIWGVGAFRFLEKLIIWDCTVESPTTTFSGLVSNRQNQNFYKCRIMNMDSFLTGIPFAICDNLRKHGKQNLMDSPFNEILRDSPSLLQLKNLRELIICVRPDYEWDGLPEEPPFISMISVWYALQMIPNLQAKFVYECKLSTSYDEEERKQHSRAVAMLKEIFKHVQPYVKLEPFYY